MDHKLNKERSGSYGIGSLGEDCFQRKEDSDLALERCEGQGRKEWLEEKIPPAKKNSCRDSK